MKTTLKTFSRMVKGVACAAAAMCLAVVPAGAQSQSGFTYNGVVLLSYQANEYTGTSAAAAKAIRTTEANFSAVLVTQYQANATANSIASESSSSPGYMSNYATTPTDAALVAAIQNLQAQGITVVMKPQVDSLDGTFRGNFTPSSPNDWFASYSTFLLHYAQLATQNNVGVLVIGTELAKLSGSAYKANWETLISQLRTLYPSLTLAYAANATGAGDEFTSVSFWQDIDIIGVDGYFPLTGQADPTVAQLVAAWSNNKSGFNPLAALKNLQSMYSKPLIFTEIGYVSSQGTNEQPYANLNGPLDTTEQANCFEAFFEVYSQQTAWMKGVFWWGWSTTPPGTNDTGYSPQNKPAGNTVFPKWFGSASSSFTLAGSNPILTVTQGSSSGETISVTPLNGFSGQVALAAGGLPAGVTASFSTSPTSGTSTLMLTASSAAKAGTTAITVTGTSSSLTASTTINLTVSQPQGLTLLAFAPAVSVVQAASSTDSLAIAGGSGAVTLTASGLPSGVTASFSQNPATTASILTLTASSAATVTGPVTVTITGTSGASTASTTIALTVLASPGFTLSGTGISFTAGSITGNTSTISITPAGGFTGSIVLSCSISPVAASKPATCAVGPAMVPISGPASQVTMVTITSTAATPANSRLTPLLWPAAGTTALAGMLFLVLPRRRNAGLRLFGMLLLVLPLSIAAAGCNGTAPGTPGVAGTTPGTYMVTVTGTAGALTASTVIPVTIQ